MSSYRTRFDVQPTINRVGGSADGLSLLGDVGRLRLVRGVGADSHAALGCAAATIEQVEQEIDRLWFDSMKAENLAMSQRLAEVSHALQRAARLLEHDDAIG